MKKNNFTTFLASLFLLFVLSKTANACPPPIEITINCPSGDCDITIVTGDNNEISKEEKSGTIADIIDDVLDFFRDIFKRKDGGNDNDENDSGEDTSGGSTTEGNNNNGGASSGGGNTGSNTAEEQASHSSFDQQLDSIATYFSHATVTENGLLLHYAPTQQCQSSFTMQYNTDIKVPYRFLKKYNINGSRYLKAGRYTTNAKGIILLPFKK